MPDERSGEFRAAVDGTVRNRSIRGVATIRIGERGLALAFDTGELRLPFGRLDGWRIDGDAVLLRVAGGDVLSVHPSGGPEGLSQAIGARAFVLPELTRPLRALGSARARADAAQQDVFAPLLAARRRAARTVDVDGRVRALDAALLSREVQEALARLAASHVRQAGPERRALDAALEDAAAPLRAAIVALEARALAFGRAGDDRRLAAWRAWTDGVRAIFGAADAAWPAIHAALEGARQPPPRWRRWTHLGLLALGVLLPPSSGIAQHRQLRVDGVDGAELRRAGFDVVWIGRDFSIVVADSAEAEQLRVRGAALRELETPVARAVHARPALQLGAVTTVYRSFDDPARGIAFFLDSLARANPLVTLDTIGQSVEGRAMLSAKIGAPDDSPGRPNVLFVATYHAREWAATEMALRLLAFLASVPDSRVDSLVARRDIWIVPVVNPDGYEYTHTTDRFWRKNRSRNSNGTHGVDLNRNHDFNWGLDELGSSSFPGSDLFRGTAPHSEPETQAIAAMVAAHPPVLGVSYHTFTGLVLYPWGYAYGLLPDDWSIYRALAGTDVHPSVIDRLPGASRDRYHPTPSWNLYVTNGDFSDWAYGRHGVLAFTPELTSGWEGSTFYGFDFPDDEARLQQVFADNLPFALDVLDAAADPLRARPSATGLVPAPVELESLSPAIRIRVPLGTIAGTRVRTPAAVPLMPDTVTRRAAFSRRLVSPRIGRPTGVVLDAAGASFAFDVLAATGAEPADEPWTATGWARVADPVAGDSAWAGAQGMLRSPPITVPADADTVSVLFWTRYSGDAFDLSRHGAVQVSEDGGSTWRTVAQVAGFAPVYYPERADIAGVAGKTIHLAFAGAFLGDLPAWWIDEVTVVRQRVVPSPGVAGPLAVQPSENPVRGGEVRFRWPFAEAGAAAAYDAAGRAVWSTDVSPAERSVTWSLDAHPVANGVYFVVLRSGRREARGRVFVLRSGG